jgi:hypothetical protein
MEWALTVVVLSSVSLLVVALTMGHGTQTVEHRSSLTVSAGRSLVVLRHLLLNARSVAITTGHRLGRGGRTALRQGGLLAVAVGRGAQARVREGGLSRGRRLAVAPTIQRRARARQLRFEDCLQMTGPVAGESGVAQRSAPSLALMPAPRGWLSRLVAALELVVVIALAGGAIAVALILAGWKASGHF